MTRIPNDTLQTDNQGSRRQFHFKRCLGRGGFGEVYLATLTSPGGVAKDVAVKVLHAGLDPRSQAIQRLMDEGRLLGVLNHPSILTIHDLVVVAGRVALITEYVIGADLDDCLKGPDPIGLRAVLEVIARVGEALHAAYTASSRDGEPLHLVHRDVKPSNIRIGIHGEVKLLDFGIAKATNLHREAKTQTNTVLGSMPYLAPERFDEGGDTPLSDVYSLGCTLYEVIQREHLFEGLSVRQQYFHALDPEKHDAFVGQKLQNMRKTAPEVQSLLSRMLQYEPEKRPEALELDHLCDEAGAAIGGLTLRRWAKARNWPPVASDAGELEGQVITEATDPREITSTLAVNTGESSIVQRTREADEKSSETMFGMFDSTGETGETARDDTAATGSRDLTTGGRRRPVWLLPVAILFGVGSAGAVVVAVALVLAALSFPSGEETVETEPETPATIEPVPEPAPAPDPVVPEPVAPEPVQPVAPEPRPVAPEPRPVAPEPAPAPVASPAPASDAGKVLVVGDATDVVLVGASGERVSPSDSVPAGRYKVAATFPGTGEITGRSFTLLRGQTVTVHCKAGFFRCDVE